MSFLPRLPRVRRARAGAGPVSLLAAFTLALGSCADSITQPRQEAARLSVTAAVAGTPIATIVITVAAADIPRPLVFNLTVHDGLATGTLRVPPGPARLFTAQGFDATGEVTHEGAATADVKKGDNPPLAIAMLPRTGQVPITITIGSVNVVVTPAALTLPVGATQQLAAAITDEGGHAVPGAVPVWASSNPAVASVDPSGLVTTHAVGETLLMAVFAGGAGTSTVTVTSAPDPATAKIAFASDRDGNDEIYVMSADGSGQTRLTNNPASDNEPAWSPDRARIAFRSDRDGRYQIYVMNADGSGQTRLTNNGSQDMQPSWSPDGTRIAFTSSRDGNYEIYVMNADGTGQTRLTNSPTTDWKPAWSPDGARIAFERDPGNTFYAIYVMNADGTGATRLTYSSGIDDKPAWSPDGARIAFASYRDCCSPGPEIYVMNADGTAQTRLTNNSSVDRNVSWSPDGARIAFASDRNGNMEIYLMNPDGTGVTRLTSNAASDDRPAWR